MNPLTNMKNIKKLSEQELKMNLKTSWHDQYKDSAWIFVGGLPYDLTEGDIICIFSQYGEIVNINLVRDKDTGKSKGFCFICYEDQRSTVLAVDNLNGIKVVGRIIRVDHVAEYKVPKEGKKTDEETKRLYREGCAPQTPNIEIKPIKVEPDDIRETLADQISGEIRLPPRLPIYPIKQEKTDDDNNDNEKNAKKAKKKKDKKKKKKKEKSKKKKKRQSSDDSGSTSETSSDEESTKIEPRKNSENRNQSKDRYKSESEEINRSSDNYKRNKRKTDTKENGRRYNKRQKSSTDNSSDLSDQEFKKEKKYDEKKKKRDKSDEERKEKDYHRRPERDYHKSYHGKDYKRHGR